MEEKYFDTESTGENDIFKDKGKDSQQHKEEKTTKDFDISTDKYNKIEIKVEITKYDIKD